MLSIFSIFSNTSIYMICAPAFKLTHHRQGFPYRDNYPCQQIPVGGADANCLFWQFPQLGQSGSKFFGLKHRFLNHAQ
jgi:hypothetical protein